jgi:hypothetical protein
VHAARRPFSEVHADRDVLRFGQREVRLEGRIVERQAAILRTDFREHGETAGPVQREQFVRCVLLVCEERNGAHHASRSCRLPALDQVERAGGDRDDVVTLSAASDSRITASSDAAGFTGRAQTMTASTVMGSRGAGAWNSMGWSFMHTFGPPP